MYIQIHGSTNRDIGIDINGKHLSAVALPQVVRQVVLDLGEELLGVVGVEAQHLTQALEADVLQVTVGQRLHTGVGLDHFLLGQAVGADQVTPTWRVGWGKKKRKKEREGQSLWSGETGAQRSDQHHGERRRTHLNSLLRNPASPSFSPK